MKELEKEIKVKLLDYSPKYKEFSIDAIISASGILTTKLDDIDNILKNCNEETIKKFHEESTRRGHASLTTSANFYFWIEGTKVLDFYFSNFPFGSYIISSTRRITFSENDLSIPSSIYNSDFRKDYENVCKELLAMYLKVRNITNSVDSARKLLPLSIPTRGFFSFPLQTIIGMIKEIEREKDLYPKEIITISEMIKEECLKHATFLTEASLQLVYDTSFGKENIYNGNFYIKEEEIEEIEYGEPKKVEKIYLTKDAIKKIIEFEENIKNLTELKIIAEKWKTFSSEIKNEILFRVVSSISLACYTDLKRHRTMKQNVESVYKAIDRALLNPSENFYFPPVNEEIRDEIEKIYIKALELYQKMINNGIPKTEALYILPLGLKIRFQMFIDGYHIFDPFGFIGIRSCTTADHEIVEFVNWIISQLVEEDLPQILIGPKCKLGFCPERNFCNVIKRFNKEYNEILHKRYSKF